MPIIPSSIQESVTIVRKTADTRNTFSTVASDVAMSIQPSGGGLRFGDMQFMRQNLYQALLKTVNASILQGDIVRRAGENDLAVLRVDTIGSVQQLTLSESQRAS